MKKILKHWQNILLIGIIMIEMSIEETKDKKQQELFLKKNCLYLNYPDFWEKRRKETTQKQETPCVAYKKLIEHYKECKNKNKDKVFKIINKEMDEYYE